MEGASQPTCTNHGLQRFVIVASMMMLKSWFGTVSFTSSQERDAEPVAGGMARRSE
jgi:hypothetical protein